MNKPLTKEQQEQYEKLLDEYKDDEMNLRLIKSEMNEGADPKGLKETLEMF